MSSSPYAFYEISSTARSATGARTRQVSKASTEMGEVYAPQGQFLGAAKREARREIQLHMGTGWTDLRDPIRDGGYITSLWVDFRECWVGDEEQKSKVLLVSSPAS